MAGEVVISFAAEAILSKMASMVTEEISLASSLKKEIEILKDKSKLILALLRDAEKSRVKEESVILWLKNMKDAVYDAEDVSDMFAFEMLRRKLETQHHHMKNKTSNFFSVSNPINFRFKMAHKVKDTKMVLDRVVEQGIKLGLNQSLHRAIESPKVTANYGEFRQTNPFVDDTKVWGREADKSKVRDMLLQSRSEEDLSVIAIVGLPGLGKTTLAQLIYKDEGVNNHFNENIWVCVSDDFNVTRLLKEMTGSLMLNIGETSNIEAMNQKLKEKLNGKKLLLVLDDVWNKDGEKWECLRNSLLEIGGGKGSKILVTTRNEEVVSTLQNLSTHYLAGLSEGESWSIFRDRAFASGGAKVTPYLVDVGKSMIRRCKGVPLAIKTLGALMHSKEEHEWSSMVRSELWDLSNDESSIMSALRLSFDHFPSPYVKQCFAYCSIFPKDTEFQKDNLIQLWMAQGFIQPIQGSLMEDTGNHYFKILLWNSFFQDVKLDMFGKIKTCKMHDLAQSISKSECLVLDAGKVNDNTRIRHLSLVETKGVLPVIPKENVVKLRTLFLACSLGGNFLVHYKCLRALNLECSDIKELPNSIGELKNLRYLNISKTAIKAFPESIIKLYNLQTLRLMGCHKLEELPKYLRSLINLRHLCFDLIHVRQMPIEMGRLTNLQTLPFFVVGSDKGGQIEELGSLNKLRGDLEITNLECVKDKNEAKSANLSMKTDLCKLRLAWSSGREGGNTDEEVLEGLQSPPNLRSFTIEEFEGTRFPSSSWTMNGNSVLHDSLVEIRLKNCRRCQQIPTLGELPNLRFLEIVGMDNLKCIGKEFYSSSSSSYGIIDSGGASSSYTDGGTNPKRSIFFPALETFMLERMSNLVEWTDAAGGGTVTFFPCLEKLTINDCQQLKSTPTCFPSLRSLWIKNITSALPIAMICSQLTTLTSLSIWNVPELHYLHMYQWWQQMLVSLEHLSISYCPILTSIPSIKWRGLFGQPIIPRHVA